MRPTLPLAQAMIASGMEAYLATVDRKKLSAEFAGRKFDLQLLDDLPAGVDPCGENGEFHTCVVAGAIFLRPVLLTCGERGGHHRDCDFGLVMNEEERLYCRWRPLAAPKEN